MSRLDASRWTRILAWSGAALAWGGAITANRLEAARSTQPEPEPPAAIQRTAPVPTAMPAAPSRGLVILRYAPVATAEPEVRTVYVKRAAPATSTAVAPAPSAPAARSGGS